MIWTALNPEGHQHCITGSKGIAILLLVTLPIGGVALLLGKPSKKFRVGAPKFGIGHLIYKKIIHIFADIFDTFQIRAIRPSAN